MVHALSNDRALRSGNYAYPFDAYHHNLYCIDDAREMKNKHPYSACKQCGPSQPDAYSD